MSVPKVAAAAIIASGIGFGIGRLSVADPQHHPGLAAENVSSADQNSDNTIAELIVANSALIGELGQIAGVMEETSDIMMRYSHYTDNHTEQVPLCPECGTESILGDETVPEEPAEEIPETMEQLLADARELGRSVGSLKSGMVHQRTALRHHLERLRETAGNKSP